MKRVFIQSYCKYPRGGALANYTENLVKAISNVGYPVILISDINPEYSGRFGDHFNHFAVVYEIKPSKYTDEYKMQREHGFAAERIGALRQEAINAEDVVIVLGIMNLYMLEELFAYRKQIGFKIVCAVLEMFGQEDFNTNEKYYDMKHIKEEVYAKADAILSISKWIDAFYENKGVKTYCIPPLTDIGEACKDAKKMGKYSFVIPTTKDSFSELLMAFSRLTQSELQKIEIHICNAKQEKIFQYLSETAWEKIREAVVCHEWMKYEELLELYRQMHFLVIARKESQRTLANFPSKVPECMNLGIVPVVSAVGDYTKYYLQNGKDSIFIKGDRREEIITALRKAINLSAEEFLQYSDNAKECARTRFDYHVWEEQIREMIEIV